MAISALLSGIQWAEADGVAEYLRLVLVNKPFIPLVTVVVFLLSGVMMQIGKFHFRLSYYEISIIWLATSWVSLTTLWLVKRHPAVVDGTDRHRFLPHRSGHFDGYPYYVIVVCGDVEIHSCIARNHGLPMAFVNH